MAITNDPRQYGKAIERTEEINLIPNNWGLLQQLRLFTNKYSSQKTILIPRTTENESILEDRNWDERNPSLSGAQRDYLPLQIPHYPVDDAILPNDVDGNITWDSVRDGGLQLETINEKRVEKMERIRRAHALTLEFARMQVLKNGTVYSPRNTVTINYYSQYGISRYVESVDLASTTVAPNEAIESAIGHLQDSLMTGDVATGFVALCSPEFYGALISNPFIQERYFHIQNSQQAPLLVDRLTAGSPLDARYRTFDFAGVTFIEVRGAVAGTPYITAGDAYMFPRGTAGFETWFAPANRLSTINTRAQESYLFEYVNRKDDIIELMSETNFLNVLKRPDQVITLRNEEVQ